MKLRTYKDLSDNVYRADIQTEDWSQADKELMADFSEPEIDLGGVYAGTAAVLAGAVDLRDAGNHNSWTTSPEELTITINNETDTDTVVVLALNADCTTPAEVAALITASIAAQGYTDLLTADAGSMYLYIRSVETGVVVELSVTGSGTTTLGLTTDLQNGAGITTMTLPSNLSRIYSDTPFSLSLDARDEKYEGEAERQLNYWVESIGTKISGEIIALRAKSDIFSGEQVTNI